METPGSVAARPGSRLGGTKNRSRDRARKAPHARRSTSNPIGRAPHRSRSTLPHRGRHQRARSWAPCLLG
eukprot:1102451-Prorocentrum_lima.AAC.1